MSLVDETLMDAGTVQAGLLRMAEAAERQHLVAGTSVRPPDWAATIPPAELIEGVCLALQSLSLNGSRRAVASSRGGARLIDAVQRVLCAYRARLEKANNSPRPSEPASKNVSNDLKQTVEASIAVSEAIVTSVHMLHDVETMHGESKTAADAIGRLVSSLRNNAGSGQQVADATARTEQAVRQSIGALEEMARSMERIVTAVDRTASQTEAMKAASSQIGKILQTIEALAKQTNLLALNATIEAARAGEAGRGFAVVAGEVKALAGQTTSAAGDIRASIEEVQSGTAGIVTAMEAANQAVALGRDNIARLNTEMSEVFKLTEIVSQRIGEIVSTLEGDKNVASQAGAASERSVELARTNSDEVRSTITSLEQAAKLVLERVNQYAGAASSRDLVQIAKSDHVAFKKRLTDALTGRASWKASEVPDEHSCRLGKWYDNVTEPEILGQQAYRKLREPHAALHTAARGALLASEQGDQKGALEGLERFVGAAKQVVSLLDEIAHGLSKG